jgi:NAD(P)-dependent dehydrogenase (short-subunit alcohol dehydrogenase family)
MWASVAWAADTGAMNAKANSAGTNAGPGQKIILVTGSTAGLGREVARRLAASGAHVIVHGRNRERGMEVVSEIEKAGKGSAKFYAADLASLAAVREFGDAILRDYPRLDVLVNNAGIWLDGRDGRQLSADGQEMHFAVNYLSGYLLTRILLPRLIASAPSRIVNVASGSQTKLEFDDLKLDRNYSDGRAYGVSKLAQVMFTFDLARELRGTGVTVNVLHPASLMDTNMVLAHGVAPQSSVAEGAEAVMQLITAPRIEAGQYFEGQRPTRAHAQAYDPEAREKLARISRELVAPYLRAASQ